MLIPAKYILTPKISQLLSSIEACREVIDSIQIPTEIEVNIRRQGALKSSLFSARIEGNDLTLDDIQTTSKSQKKLEVFNLLKALNLLTNSKKKDLDINDILTFHKIILNNLITQENLAKFRNEVNAIFNSSGIAIYLPPPPKSILPLINRLINYSNSDKEQFIPIKACLTHYAFEKIHPFLDGNGRVGRLMLQKIMTQGGYGMKGLLSVEEYLDNHRSSYYQALEVTERDATDYLEFMLEAIAQTAIQAKNLVLQKQKADATDFLLPRRAEIYSIIKDHQLINFDMIRRRFMAVNERTLRYDLKKLQDKGLIRKRGITKGVYYQITEKMI